MPGAADERRGGYLRVVRVKLLHSQLPSTIAASLTAAAVAATLLYSLDPGVPLGQWFIAMVGVACLRAGQLLCLRCMSITTRNVARWCTQLHPVQSGCRRDLGHAHAGADTL